MLCIFLTLYIIIHFIIVTPIYFKNRKLIKENFDNATAGIAERFAELGLDNTLVLPSYVVDVSSLQAKIKSSEQARPELSYHKDNEVFLDNIIKEIKLITGELYA